MHSIKERSSLKIEPPSTHSSRLGHVVNVSTQHARAKFVTWLSDDLHNMRFFRAPCNISPTDLKLTSAESRSDSDDSMPELESDNDDMIADFLSGSDSDSMPELEDF